MFENVIKINYL